MAREHPITVTLVGTLPPLKGLSPYCLALAQALEQEVDLEFLGFRRLYPDFLYPGGTRIKKSDSSIDPLKKARVRNLLTYYNPLSWLWGGLTLRGQVVHAQWWSYVLAVPYAVLLMLAKIRKRRCVLTLHNILPHEHNRLAEFLNRAIFRFGDHFIVHNKGNEERLIRQFGVPAHRISVIPHGVLEPAPRAGISRGEARAVLEIPHDARVVLFFGNIRDYKGVDDLILAMAQVVATDPRAFLVIAGQPWKSPEIYEEAVRNAGLADRSLLHLGFVAPERVEVFFTASDVLALPYKYFDSQSGVGAFSLFYGLPMVVTDVGGLADLVGESRLIVPPGDVPALAQVLSSVLGDEELLSALAAKTREKAGNYQWGDIAAATVNVYRGVVYGDPAPAENGGM